MAQQSFWPKDTDNEFFIAREMDLPTILTKIKDKWPNVPLDKIRIESEYIHTDCITYDLYDPSDYTNFIKVSLDIAVEVGEDATEVVAETLLGSKVVKNTDTGLYDVLQGGVVRHPNCLADDAIRASMHYLNSSEQRVIKLVEDKEQMEIDHRAEILDAHSRH